MLLTEWLDLKEMTYADFADRVGFSFRTVEKWARGERYPSYRATKQILVVTSGDVTAEDHFVAADRRHHKSPLPSISE